MKKYNINSILAGFFLLIAALFSFCKPTPKTEEITTETVAAPPKSEVPTTASAHEHTAAVSAPAMAPSPTGKLPTDLVCMVNNAYMGKKQVPVAFENKTYFGCCNMCVDKIKNSREVRFATDPITGKEVDKATAFITLKPGSTSDVLYFESEESYKRFSQK